MSDFKVEPQALEQFASGSMNRRHDFDDLHTRLQNVHVPRDSFGYIPGIGGRVYDAYEEFVHGCADSIASAAESMASIAAAVRGVISAYATSDQKAHDSQTVIQSDLNGVNIRGVK
jgi:hypothetical protein